MDVRKMKWPTRQVLASLSSLIIFAFLRLPLDLNNSDSNAVDAQSDKSSSSYAHTPSRKRRADGSPIEV